MPNMTSMEPLRQQHLHRVAQQLLALVAEELFRPRVDQHNLASSINNLHGIRRRLQQRSKLVFLRFARAHVTNRADHHVAVGRMHRAQADLRGKLSAIFARSSEVEPDAHGTGARLAEKTWAVTGMLGAETRR